MSAEVLHTFERAAEIDLPESRKRGHADTDPHREASEKDEFIHTRPFHADH
jgi:hypothetical protein